MGEDKRRMREGGDDDDGCDGAGRIEGESLGMMYNEMIVFTGL